MSEETASGNHPQVAPKAEVVAVEGGPAAPSKNALKKAAKEKEKAEKAAKRAEDERKAKEAAVASDVSRHLYGDLPKDYKVEDTPLSALTKEHQGKQVTIEARVFNARVQSAKLAFLHLREGTLDIQAVIAESVDAGEASVSRQMVKWCGGLNTESIVLVTGLVQIPLEPVHSTRIPGLEVHVQRCYLISRAPEMTPIMVKDADSAVPQETEAAEDKINPVPDLSVRLDNRIIDLRTRVNDAIFSVNHKIQMLFQEFMHKEGFRKSETPKLLGAATEGGASVFQLGYFGRPAYLAQSPQFYKEMLIAAGWPRVYEIGPVFRAENSNTARHLTEFTGLDFEMRLKEYSEEGWQQVVRMAEDMVLYIFRRLPEQAKTEIEEIRKHYPKAGDFKLPEGRPPRIKFAEGIALLKEAGFEAAADEDISTTNEKALGDIIRTKYSSDFFTMTHYPVAARPFYTHLDPMDAKYTNSYDGFVRGQEIVSGAQRVHDYNTMRERMKSMGVNPDEPGYKDYLEAFKQACPPHGGAGFGLNRMTMLYLGLPNVRLATLFPRDPNRLVP